jgi:SAM domain (Sterile alpha motif)
MANDSSLSMLISHRKQSSSPERSSNCTQTKFQIRCRNLLIDCVMSKPFETFEVHDVVDLLDRLELDALIPKFKENAVTGKDLLELSDEDLKTELGMTNLQVGAQKLETSRTSSQKHLSYRRAPIVSASNSLVWARKKFMESEMIGPRVTAGASRDLWHALCGVAAQAAGRCIEACKRAHDAENNIFLQANKNNLFEVYSATVSFSCIPWQVRKVRRTVAELPTTGLPGHPGAKAAEASAMSAPPPGRGMDGLARLTERAAVDGCVDGQGCEEQTETNRTHLVLLGMQHRTFGPCLAAIDKILISVMANKRAEHLWEQMGRLAGKGIKWETQTDRSYQHGR